MSQLLSAHFFMPTQQFFSYVMAGTSYISMRNDAPFVLFKQMYVCWFYYTVKPALKGTSI